MEECKINSIPRSKSALTFKTTDVHARLYQQPIKNVKDSLKEEIERNLRERSSSQIKVSPRVNTAAIS